MTTTISVDDETKRRFDDTRPDDFRSAGAFVEELLNCYEAIHGDRPDPVEAEQHTGTMDAEAVADAVAEVDMTLEAAERQRIAEEVAEVLR